MISLIFPPPWDVFTPYSALPVLLSDLKSKNIEAEGLDLNLRLIKNLLTPEYLTAAYQKIVDLDIEGYPDNEKSIYTYIMSRVDFTIGNINNAKTRLLDKKYGLAAPPRVDWETLSLATQLLSFPFYPSLWHRNTYWIYGLFKKRPQTFDDVFTYIKSMERDFFAWAYEREEILPLILKDKADVIGISVCTLTQVIPVFVLCSMIKKYRPNTHVVLGGPFLRYIKEPILKTPEIFDYADSIVFGRGEDTLASLYLNVTAGKKWQDTPGITCREDGRVKTNDLIDKFQYNRFSPPDYTAMNYQEYLCDEQELSYISSSGCYWGKCAFCSETPVSEDFRYMVKSADIVCEEIHKIYNETGIRVFEMADNAIPFKKALQIADYIIKNKLPIIWTMLSRVEEEFGYDELKHLYQGGLRFVSWGIETFSQKIQKYINKGINLETGLKILENSHKVGIWNHLFVIIGFPGETKEDMFETLGNLEGNSEYIDSISLSNFHLHRNSHMFSNPSQYGISIREGSERIIDTSYWYDGPDVNLDMPIEGMYGLFELYLSNFHFHTSNFKGFSTARLVSLIDEQGKGVLRDYFTKESYAKTLELEQVLL